MDLFFGASQYWFGDDVKIVLDGVPTTRERIPIDPKTKIPKDILQALNSDPLKEARARNLPYWFVAGYGVGRALPAALATKLADETSTTRDRLASLFDPSKQVIGTGFADAFPPERAEQFNAALRKVFVDGGLLPHVTDIELAARGRIERRSDLRDSHKVTLELNKGRIDVPTTGLSHGYQATMAWISDLIGQAWWEDRENTEPIPTTEMEGICLVDELDLHLHPKWQAMLIPALKKAFPRMQFIATTHSPMLLSGLEQDEILILEQDEEGNVVPRPAPEAPKLMTGSEIYRSFFGIDRQLPADLDKALFRYATLAGYAGRTDEEEAEVQELLRYLRKHQVEPGWDPVAREKPPTPRPTRSRSKPRAKIRTAKTTSKSISKSTKSTAAARPKTKKRS